ncbi:hypothetical protein GCM10027195_06360 [Comamonas sediminis]
MAAAMASAQPMGLVLAAAMAGESMPAIIAAAETLCGLRLRQRLSIYRLLQAVAGSGRQWLAMAGDHE